MFGFGAAHLSRNVAKGRPEGGPQIEPTVCYRPLAQLMFDSVFLTWRDKGKHTDIKHTAEKKRLYIHH